jgi:hypothetical protein
MKTSALVLIAVLTAAPMAAQRTRAIVVVPGQITTVVTDTMGTLYELPFAPARTYKAVLDAFAELKIPAEVRDSLQGRVESNVFYRRGDLGGKQLSTYFNCGDGQTGPMPTPTDLYRGDGDGGSEGDRGSTIRTILLGGAVPVAEGARQPMACESTGRLEIRMHKLVLQKAASQ